MNKQFDKEFIQRVNDVFEKILMLYEERDGDFNEDDKTAVTCPECGEDTKHYTCAWDYNKHVGFYCPSCELSIRE